MKKFIISSILVLLFSDLFSQTYLFDSIPDNLKSRADAVIRSQQCLFTLLKPGNAVVKYKTAITLLNDKSKQYRFLRIYYDKFSRVNNLKGAIYDEKGKMIKALGLIDTYDMSAITGGTFYSDDRMKVLYFPLYKYPYTIEYEYEITYSSLMNYPSWEFQESPGVSVERSGIQYIVPGDMKLRYYGENLKNDVDSVLTPDEKIYTWQEENLPAIPVQEYFVTTEYNFPVLHTAPLDFEYGGYKGSMTSWKKFGEWIYNLNKGRDALPATDLEKVTGIVARTKDVRERTRLIYEYMQSRTRYVSVQIGIGGFRPAEATAVSANGFGDCKALVNYTQALLRAADITSFYTLVQAGEQHDINPGFVDNQFNHVILCVPMKQDTVWLDCTDQRLPFNFLGSFTSDRHVLLITPDGGKIVKTPGFVGADNVLNRTGSVYLNVLGSSSGKISSTYSGYLYEVASLLFDEESDEEIKQYLISGIRFPDLSISSVSYGENKSEKPVSDLKYDLSINNFATGSGNRLFFTPSLNREQYLQDIPSGLVVGETRISVDSIVYILPHGYKAEYVPENVDIRNDFGEFRYKLKLNNDRVIYERYQELKKETIPIDKFSEFRTFINTLAKTDRQMIILSKVNP